MLTKAIIIGKSYYDFTFQGIFGILKAGHFGIVFRH